MSPNVEHVSPQWPERLRRAEASIYLAKKHGLKTAPATLAKLAVTGGGPEYDLWGRVPYYPIEKLDQWVHKRLLRRRSSSDRGTVPSSPASIKSHTYQSLAAEYASNDPQFPARYKRFDA